MVTPPMRTPRSHQVSSLSTPLRAYLVEDSQVIRENLIAALEEMLPLKVVGVSEEESVAVAWLKDPNNDCDIAIIDILLKRGNGLGVLNAIRGAHTSVRRVVMSNFATKEMRRTCLALGADEVFDKSHDIDALVRYCAQLAQTQSADARRTALTPIG